MNAPTDTQLMLAVKQGDSQMLGTLYERYKDWLFRFFLQLHGNSALGEDMVQTVFMRILKYKHTYTEDSKYVTWMFQIARNVNNDHFRKREQKHVKEEIDKINFKLSDYETADERIEKQESSHLLHRALQKLPIDKREVIVLSKLKELKYREVATILGCTENTARMKAHRALIDLKEIYLSIEKN